MEMFERKKKQTNNWILSFLPLTLKRSYISCKKPTSITPAQKNNPKVIFSYCLCDFSNKLWLSENRINVWIITVLEETLTGREMIVTINRSPTVRSNIAEINWYCIWCLFMIKDASAGTELAGNQTWQKSSFVHLLW